MEFLSDIFGYGSVVLLATLALLDCRDCKSWTQRIILAGVCLSTMAYVITIKSQPWSSAPMPTPDWLYRVMVFAHVPNIIFIWLFGLLIFKDRFRLEKWHYALAISFLIPGFTFCILGAHTPYERGLPSLFFGLYGLALMGHLIFVTARGYNHDLIDRRRRIRLIFIGALIAITVGVLLAEMGVLPMRPDVIAQIQLGSIFIMSVWVFFWMAKVDEGKLFFNELKLATAPVEPMLDARDEVLKTKLLSLMETDKLFMQAGLTIPALAKQAGTSEHRLRRVINKGLGYRNFSAFLNTYRINAIKVALGDPEKASLPILTLAMDYGYSSLAPFNRAFREVEDMTPSEYRQTAL